MLRRVRYPPHHEETQERNDMTAHFIGLDLETSGTEIEEGAVPIQLGMAVLGEDGAEPDIFKSNIGWPGFNGPPARDTFPSWSDEAEGVHNLTQDTVMRSPSAVAVGLTAREWINVTCEGENRAVIIPVGWNISSFDMPFIKRYLPGVQAIMSYRSVDLNAVCFSIAAAGLPSPLGGRWKLQTLRKIVHQVSGAKAAISYGGHELWHDAAFDALASLYAWEALIKVMQSDDPR